MFAHSISQLPLAAQVRRQCADLLLDYEKCFPFAGFVLGVGLPSSVRLCFGQPCSPCESGRFRRPSPHSAYTYTPSGASPAVIVSLSKVPPGWRPKTKPRVAPLVELVAERCTSASLPLPAPSLPASSRRYAPQCFVGGIPPSRLATCTTAHPPNRAVACRSARHSARRSASSLHVKPIQANPTTTN